MASSDDTTECFDDTTMEMLSANLPSNAFNVHEPDPRLERARQEMERTNQITPVLKEELRLRILSKRLQKGEPEIEIKPGEPKRYELTEEEKAKRERRNAQNRRAAKKCREKRKMKLQTDAEKYRHIREQNQQLRNGVTYLLHKEEVYKKFCIEHILNSQCPAGTDDEHSRRRLMALLGPEMLVESHGHHRQGATLTSLTAMSAEGSSTSPHTDLHSNYQSQACCMPESASLQSSTTQAMLHTEKAVACIVELREIPIHEISSLLPPESDFSVSDHDHSLECSLPDRSPSSSFPPLLPGSSDASYFAYLTPATSYSSNNHIRSFPSSNEGMFAMSATDNNILLSSSYLNSSGSSPALPGGDMSTDYLSREPSYDDHIPQNSRAAVNHYETRSELHLPTQPEGQCGPPTKLAHPNTSQHISGNITPIDRQNVFSVAVTTNNVIVNTALLSEITHNPERFLSSYISAEQLQNMTHSFTSFTEEPRFQSVPFFPLSPRSPCSPNVTHSPNLVQSPLSPSSLSADKDHPAAHTSYHSAASPNPATPARPSVRRVSSSTSVASPFSSQHVSVGLSPPPSVPSPASNGLPESPPILALSSACTEMAYLPHHMSSFCTAPSTQMELDFN